MKRTAVFGILAVLLLAGVGIVAAQGWGQGMHANTAIAQGTYHDQMESILEEGNYDDLVSLREETGRTMMPWVQDEASFAAWQERHASMEQYWEEQGIEPGQRGFRTQGRFGCPMMG